MNRPLVRVFRLRALLEEVSRMELEGLAQQASRIERARARQRDLAITCRREALSLIPDAKSGETGNEGGTVSASADRAAKEGWTLAEAARNMAEFRARQLEPLAQIAMLRVEAGREEFFLRRKERQQAETVLQNEAALRKIDQERREQRVLDDWFAMMQVQSRLDKKSSSEC